MSKCSNCGATLSCGCQKRVASDGHPACTNCLASYEAKIAADKKSARTVEIPRMNQNIEPKVTNIQIDLG